MSYRVLWSVHDVSPGSIARAGSILDFLSSNGITSVCILVIPSGEWTGAQLDLLRDWERRGYTLAVHGWTHRSAAPRSLHHRLHSTFFSRDAAEHLGKTAVELREIVRRGERWFAEAGLAPPRLYVPPAWAIGSLSLAAFGDTNYRWVETLSGIYSVRDKRFRHLPVAGFEADTLLRATALAGLNRVNRSLARVTSRPLRVAIHPNDFDLRLARDLDRAIRDRDHQAVSIEAI